MSLPASAPVRRTNLSASNAGLDLPELRPRERGLALALAMQCDRHLRRQRVRLTLSGREANFALSDCGSVVDDVITLKPGQPLYQALGGKGQAIRARVIASSPQIRWRVGEAVVERG